MNQNELASSSPASAPASSDSVSGQARVETLGGESGARASASQTQTPWGSTTGGGSSLPRNTLLGDFVTRVLGVVAGALSPERVRSALALAKRGGHYAVLAGGVLTIAYAIFAAIQKNSFSVFATGLVLVAALAVAQFAAMRFLDAAETLIGNTPSRVASSAFLECAGLLVLLFAASSVLTGIYAAIQLKSIAPLLPAVLMGAVLTTFGAIALHPSLVNTHPGTGTAGEEAIGLLSFAAKAGVKVAPLFFGLLAITGALAVAWSFFTLDSAIGGAALNIMALFPARLPISEGQIGSGAIIVACLIPMFAYGMFLLQHLTIDLLRAVLSLPGKLDALRR